MLGNTLILMHFFTMSKKNCVPIWVTPALGPFFLSNMANCLYLTYAFFQKEAYLYKLEKMRQDIINKNYNPSENIKN